MFFEGVFIFKGWEREGLFVIYSIGIFMNVKWTKIVFCMKTENKEIHKQA